jgi:hypothetical protein
MTAIVRSVNLLGANSGAKQHALDRTDGHQMDELVDNHAGHSTSRHAATHSVADS